jgi:fibronectin type 3 domain-containing protein
MLVIGFLILLLKQFGRQQMVLASHYKNRIMKIKITLLFLLFSIVGKAQEYKLFVASTDKTIQLKWMSKTQNSDISFDVYRKENAGTWQKINEKSIVASPVIKESELKSSKNLFPKDSAYAFYVMYKSKKETSANKQAFADYLLVTAAVYNNKLANHLGVYFEDATVSNGKKYEYKLVQSSSQKELSISEMISLGDIPPAPQEGKAIQEKQNVTLTWKVNEKFIAYNIYKNNLKINKDPVLANSENKIYKVSYNEEDVKPGNYKYTIKGITFLNTESKPSSEIIIDVKDATPAIGIKALKATRNDQAIQLTWIPSTDKEAKGYFVYKSEDKGKTFKRINGSMLVVASQEFSEKLTQDTFGTFQYYIETIDIAGNISQSMTVSAFIPDHKAPDMPKTVTSKSENGKITLSWIANTETDLLGYRIYRGLKNDDENSMLLLNAAPIQTISFTDKFPEKTSTKFIYKVSAIDQSFNESKKAEVWVQLPDVVPPNAPFLDSAVLRDNKVVLKWNLLPNEAIMSYDVYRIFENKKEKLNLNALIQDSFTDDKLGKKGMYQYFIQAVDSAKLASQPSNSLYVSSVSSNAKSEVKLIAKQDIRTKKVQLEIVGIKSDEIQSFKLFRKSGKSGFKILSNRFTNAIFIDETSESGKIYQYYIEVVDLNETKFNSEVVSMNNP